MISRTTGRLPVTSAVAGSRRGKRLSLVENNTHVTYTDRLRRVAIWLIAGGFARENTLIAKEEPPCSTEHTRAFGSLCRDQSCGDLIAMVQTAA